MQVTERGKREKIIKKKNNGACQELIKVPFLEFRFYNAGTLEAAAPLPVFWRSHRRPLCPCR